MIISLYFRDAAYLRPKVQGTNKCAEKQIKNRLFVFSHERSDFLLFFGAKKIISACHLTSRGLGPSDGRTQTQNREARTPAQEVQTVLPE